MKLVLILSLFLGLIQCTTHPHSEGRERYIRKIEKMSAGDKQFSGIYHNFEYKATLLNRDVSQSIHNRLDQYYAWGEEESREKLAERMSQLENSTRIWLSFFTNDRKDDNLANKNSIWKIYLIVDGQRYEGRTIKANENFSEAQAIFPYHSRWATAYYVEFPVPTDQIEDKNVKLLVTGPLGRREVSFPAS